METSTIESAVATHLLEDCLHVSEGLLMRVGGLPVSCAEHLKNPDVPAAIARSNELESALTLRAQELSVLLHEAVSQANGNPQLQHALLAIRRSVFNGRRPMPADIALAADHLKAHTLAPLDDWRRLKNELEAHNDFAEHLLQESMRDQRAELRRIACIPEFRKGLLLSSPSFERALEDYTRSDGRKMDRKLRRTERTLLSYLFRTTYKTSPFSTLTPVCMVRLSDDPRHPVSPKIEAREVRCAVKPNLGILARVAQAITRNACQYPQLRLSVKAGASVEGNRVKYWKRAETPLSADGPVHSRVSEHTFWIHLTPSLDAILSRMRASETMRVAEIQEALKASFNLTANEATQYIRLLIDNGFLVVSGVRQSIFDRHYWSRFVDELARTDDPCLNSVAQGISRIHHQAKEFENADGRSRPRLLESVESETGILLQSLQSVDPIPRPVLYEDSRASDKALWMQRSDWVEPMADLADLQLSLSIFDPLLVSKASLKSLFKKRYGVGGSCTNLLEFSDFFHELFYRPYQQATADAGKKVDHHNPFGRGTLNPLKLPEITNLLGARGELSSTIEEALADARGADEFRIPSEWLQRLGSEMLSWHKVLSNSFFFQVARHGGETLFVLNHIYSGFGCMLTRFTHLFADAGPDSLTELLRANIAKLQKPGTLFAELQGGHDTNLNQHVPLADAELVLPGEKSILRPERQIHISELTLKHDPNTDQVYLYCDRLGKRIVPLYLGMLYPLVLPELQMLLLHFAAPTVLRSDLSPKQLPSSGSILHQPRIRYKHVIIERAKWTVSAESVPARNSQEKDYEYMLRLAKWRAAAGIPSEVFAKLALPAEGQQPGGAASESTQGATQQAGGPQKPFYVDFDNPFCVLLLEKLITDNKGYIHFTEMLPSSRDAALHQGGEGYVSEFVAEITQGG